MNKKRKEYIEACELSEMVTFRLGGIDQKVLIEGKSAGNPIVIFLHGGPGTPIPFGAGCRGLFPDLTEKATFVFWDQWGCGINNCKPEEVPSIDGYVDMTVDLIRAVSERFPQNRISLFGVSWGSYLAARAAKAIPERISSVFTYGQIVSNLVFNDETLGALAHSSLPDEKKEQLRGIAAKSEHSLEEIAAVMKWLMKYTDGGQSKDDKMPVGRTIWGLLTSPDYSFADFKAIMVNGAVKSKTLMPELIRCDLREDLRHVQVPYLILQGERDLVTPFALVKKLADESGNPNLRFVPVPGSSHRPGSKGMDAVISEGFSFLMESETTSVRE